MEASAETYASRSNNVFQARRKADPNNTRNLMSEEGAGGKGRRRRRRPQRGGNSSNRRSNAQGPRKSSNSRKKRPQQGGRSRGGGGRAPASPSPAAARYFTGELNEFELFCAYHLGLDKSGIPRQTALKSVADRFGVKPDDIQEALTEFKLDKPRLSQSSFDVELARLDIKVAPEGIDRVEIARTLFEELLESGCGVGPVPDIPATPSAKPE